MLIPEDGTGLENADSYESVVGADDYAAAFGRTEWSTLVNNQKEIRLRLATQYIDTMFEAKHRALTDTQSLRFPVQGYFLPRDVRHACSELATYPGLPVLMPAATVNAIKSESKAIDGLKKAVVYKDFVGTPMYRVAAAKLRKWTIGSGSGGLKTGRLIPC